jgi:hypothetical protein
MRWGKLRGVMLGFAVLAASQALAQEKDLEARVKKAQEAARANAASPAGSEWKKQNSYAIDRLMILVLNRCLPDPSGDIPSAFPVYIRLSQAGHAGEILTELDASLGKCMSTVAKDLPFPEAPRDDYWIQVNLAAPL